MTHEAFENQRLEALHHESSETDGDEGDCSLLSNSFSWTLECYLRDFDIIKIHFPN